MRAAARAGPPPDEGTPPEPVPEPYPPPDDGDASAGVAAGRRRRRHAACARSRRRARCRDARARRRHRPKKHAGRREDLVARRLGSPRTGSTSRRCAARSPATRRASGRSRRRVGDVSLRLETLEADLSLHQQRLDALERALPPPVAAARVPRSAQYARRWTTLDRRLVDIYESDPASTLDVFLGATSIQDALDQVDVPERHRRAGPARSRTRSRTRSCRSALRASKTKKLRATVPGETQVITARDGPGAGRARRARWARANDLAATRQQKLDGPVAADGAGARGGAARSTRSRRRAPRSPRGSAPRRRSAAARAASSARRRRPRGLIWPVSGPVTSPFGWRWGRMHEGIDIGVAYGTPIHAAASGTVIYCGWESGLRQPDGDRPRRQPRDRLRPPELDRRRCGQQVSTGPGDRLRRLHRPLAPARTCTSRCASTATPSTRSATL